MAGGRGTTGTAGAPAPDLVVLGRYRLVDKLGERYEVIRTNIKKWSVGSPIQAPLDALLQEIAAPYGPQAAPLLTRAWEYVAQSVEAFPWDTTYLIGDMTQDFAYGWQIGAIVT